MKDYKGVRFGKLTVVEFSHEDNYKYYWKCKCDCGNLTVVEIQNLRQEQTRSCGCIKRKNLIGMVFGRLKVIKFDDSSTPKYPRWICQCECGKEKSVLSKYLKNGCTQSCGCLIGYKNNLPVEDITNKRYGELTVIRQSDSENDSRQWECRCDCGEIRVVTTHNLTSNKIKSCNKCARNITSYLNKTFGYLTVISLDESSKQSNIKFICECKCNEKDCKNQISVRKVLLKEGKVTKCSDIKQNKRLFSVYFNDIKHGSIRRNIKFDVSKSFVLSLITQQNNKCKITGLPIDIENRTASLDRIDSNLGYTEENVWWIHKDINNIKFDLSVEELLYWCNLVINKDISDTLLYTPKKVKHGFWKGYGLVRGQYIGSLRTNAIRRGLDFLIDAKLAWELFISQQGRCSITNIPLILIENTEGRTNQTASIDRIDSSKGYDINNIRWIHKTINRIKWEYPDEYFYSLCEKIVNYKKLQDPDYQFTLTV